MFLALGSVGIGAAVWRSAALGRSISVVGAFLGMGAMMMLMNLRLDDGRWTASNWTSSAFEGDQHFPSSLIGRITYPLSGWLRRS
jgi:hypothetical protein